MPQGVPAPPHPCKSRRETGEALLTNCAPQAGHAVEYVYTAIVDAPQPSTSDVSVTGSRDANNAAARSISAREIAESADTEFTIDRLKARAEGTSPAESVT